MPAVTFRKRSVIVIIFTVDRIRPRCFFKLLLQEQQRERIILFYKLRICAIFLNANSVNGYFPGNKTYGLNLVKIKYEFFAQNIKKFFLYIFVGPFVKL